MPTATTTALPPPAAAPGPTRRRLLQRGAAVAAARGGLGLLPAPAQASWNAAAFNARNLAELARVLGGAAPQESPLVTLAAPDVAENGASVAVSLASTAPGLRRLLLLVERNPTLLCAAFDVGDALEPAFALRVKMAQTGQLLAVALTADNRVLFSQREVKVTLGGCGG